MKHGVRIILTILGLFLITQFIGLAVVNSYTDLTLPFGLQEEVSADAGFGSLIISIALAIGLIFLLTRYKVKWVMRIWFFVVITLSMGITIYGLTQSYTFPWMALAMGGILAVIKTFRTNRYTHNLTELLIYPGIAAIFVPILNIITTIAFLIIFSAYDIWAVWHSSLMQKMVNFQMQEVGIFGGLLIPKISKKQREEIKKFRKLKTKNKTKKFRVEFAILGGGDIVFPIITAGVFMRAFNSIVPSLFIILGALAGLTYLFLRGKKGKGYPAMPYITTGIFIGLILWYILFLVL